MFILKMQSKKVKVTLEYEILIRKNTTSFVFSTRVSEFLLTLFSTKSVNFFNYLYPELFNEATPLVAHNDFFNIFLPDV